MRNRRHADIIIWENCNDVTTTSREMTSLGLRELSWNEMSERFRMFQVFDPDLSHLLRTPRWKTACCFFCISSIFHEFWVRHILLMRFPTPRNTIHPVQPYPKSWESQKTSGWISSLIQFDTWLFVRTAFWCRSLVFAALRLKNQVFQPNPNFSQDVEVRGILYI